ncbi:MAG: hypothetical protein H0W74_03630 [Sphingosinicella sp.]|nr:hypothetical protein [Sphingosinicella sp.]
MPRFFFHLYDDLTVIDEEGTELPDTEAARVYAIASIRELACQEIREGSLNRRHRIQVQDEKGQSVLTVPFGEAFTLED